MTVVKSGLKSGDRVVVSGQYRLKPGVKVSAAAAQPAKPEAAAQPALEVAPHAHAAKAAP